jgi:Protein of unknown function (DUF2934)
MILIRVLSIIVTTLTITYPMTELIDERLEKTTLPLPGGMSGSLLWKTNLRRAPAPWSPDCATVVGLVHRFDEQQQCLIATRIEYVSAWLLTVLRTEYAYERWLNRGEPMGDDWADWFAAKQEVVHL